MLRFLKKGPYAQVADSLEAALLEDNSLPKRTRIDGSIASLTYEDLVRHFSFWLARSIWPFEARNLDGARDPCNWALLGFGSVLALFSELK